MDMFDFIEANEAAIVESQGLRADWYEITGAHYDSRHDFYTLDICARRGSEAEADDLQRFEAEMSADELRDAVEDSKNPQEQSKMTNEEKLAHAREIARALDLKYSRLLNSPRIAKMAEANVTRMQYALEDGDQAWFDEEYLQTTILG